MLPVCTFGTINGTGSVNEDSRGVRSSSDSRTVYSGSSIMSSLGLRGIWELSKMVPVKVWRSISR